MAEVIRYIDADEAWGYAPMQEMLPTTQAAVYEAVGEMLMANYDEDIPGSVASGTVLVHMEDSIGCKFVKFTFDICNSATTVENDSGTLDE